MPLTAFPRRLLPAVLALALASGHGSAAEPIWAPRVTAQSAMIGAERGHVCPRRPPAPYAGHLRLESKYDQTDPSRSSLAAEQDGETARIRERILSFLRGTQEISRRFERAKGAVEANTALDCMDRWLESWAAAGALLSTDASGNGKAVRKWSLAALASTLMKLNALSDGRAPLSPVQRAWLEALARQVMADYGPRRIAGYPHFNNHDYWAAWAVAATGMVLGDDASLIWADTTLRLALGQVVFGGDGYAHLPHESARGALAMDYTHYALVPLVLLAEAAEVNGRPLNAEERRRLAALADFAVLGARAPRTLTELRQPQSAVPAHKMNWLLPFLKLQPEHVLARELYEERRAELGNYGQIGGAVGYFYAHGE